MIKNKIMLLQREANGIAQAYHWPSNVPQFQVRHCPQATGAYINLDTLVITLSNKHMHLPIEHVRVTLAHEIAHHYQEVIGFKPSITDVVRYRKGILTSIALGWGYTLLQAFNAFLVSPIQSDSFITIFIALMYTLLSIQLMNELLGRAQEQLLEIDADNRAIKALNTREHALAYFSNNQADNYAKTVNVNLQNTILAYVSAFPMTIFKQLLWIIKDNYISLFSTHPTDAYRIRNIQKIAHSK